MMTDAIDLDIVDVTPQEVRPVTNPITDKQRALIERLLTERETAGTAYAGWTPNWSRATKSTASTVIEFLLALPRKAQPEIAEPEAGVYSSESAGLFRVYLGQQSGKMLAKAITFGRGEDAAEVSYEYVGAAARVLPADARRLSIEEVGAFGKAWDHCLICGRRLDDPESVDQGIGPICAKRYA